MGIPDVRRWLAARPTGDMDAFERVYHRYHDFVRRSLRSMGVPAHAADDLTQDVFVVVHRRLPELTPGAPIRGWLFGIARNLARRDRDRRGRRMHLRLVSRPQAPPEPPSPDDAVRWREAADVVERFLGSLDEDKRAVFVLCELEELSAPEIARMLGVKLNTVYSRLRVARERFERAVARANAEAQRSNRGGDRGPR